jgi:UDP:flavonoid glycosyltransferase YjiC (YdhE family)
MVVCNGGSPTVYQAFAAGIPVLGIPSNLDQYLMMDYVQRYGAGNWLRAAEASLPLLARLATELMKKQTYRLRAGHLAALTASSHQSEYLDQVLTHILGPHSHGAREASGIRLWAASTVGAGWAKENVQSEQRIRRLSP